MIRSMTGFGTGTAAHAGWRVEATIRTVNHRYLNVRVRSLNDRPGIQAGIEKLIKQSFRRGDVGIWLDIQPDRTAESRPSQFDADIASETYAELRRLSESLALPAPPTLETLARVGGLQSPKEREDDLWPAIDAAVQESIRVALASRENEGTFLADELRGILERLTNTAQVVEDRLPELIAALHQRLTDRLDELELKVDPERLEAEVVLLIERYDVQEEMARLRTHIERASALLENGDIVGKELDFLSQELLREINTLGSKARDSQVASLVIDMKLAVEQFKEQIQNVE